MKLGPLIHLLVNNYEMVDNTDESVFLEDL